MALAKGPKDVARARAIGGRLKEARKAVGLKQVDVAEQLGVSERTIQAYEQGETIPHRFRGKLEAILENPASWLFDGERTPRGSQAQEQRLRDIEARLDRLENR